MGFGAPSQGREIGTLDVMDQHISLGIRMLKQHWTPMDENESFRQARSIHLMRAEWLCLRISKMLLSSFSKLRNVLGKPHPQSSCDPLPVLCVFCGNKASLCIERHHVSLLLCNFCAITSRVWIVPTSHPDLFLATLKSGRNEVELGSMRYLDVIGMILELQLGSTVMGDRGRQKWVLATLLPNGVRKS